MFRGDIRTGLTRFRTKDEAVGEPPRKLVVGRERSNSSIGTAPPLRKSKRPPPLPGPARELGRSSITPPCYKAPRQRLRSLHCNPMDNSGMDIIHQGRDSTLYSFCHSTSMHQRHDVSYVALSGHPRPHTTDPTWSPYSSWGNQRPTAFGNATWQNRCETNASHRRPQTSQGFTTPGVRGLLRSRHTEHRGGSSLAAHRTAECLDDARLRTMLPPDYTESLIHAPAPPPSHSADHMASPPASPPPHPQAQPQQSGEGGLSQGSRVSHGGRASPVREKSAREPSPRKVSPRKAGGGGGAQASKSMCATGASDSGGVLQDRTFLTKQVAGEEQESPTVRTPMSSGLPFSHPMTPDSRGSAKSSRFHSNRTPMALVTPVDDCDDFDLSARSGDMRRSPEETMMHSADSGFQDSFREPQDSTTPCSWQSIDVSAVSEVAAPKARSLPASPPTVRTPERGRPATTRVHYDNLGMDPHSRNPHVGASNTGVPGNALAAPSGYRGRGGACTSGAGLHVSKSMGSIPAVAFDARKGNLSYGCDEMQKLSFADRMLRDAARRHELRRLHVEENRKSFENSFFLREWWERQSYIGMAPPPAPQTAVTRNSTCMF
eukprot:Rmarinus@m.3369